jgi:phage terminase large subunit-like protein
VGARKVLRPPSAFRRLQGYAGRMTGSKEIRADPFAAQIQGGNVHLVAGSWHYDLLDEIKLFANGKYRDQCDACSGAPAPPKDRRTA